MTKAPIDTTRRPEPATYEIRLRGHLDMRWATQLDAATLVHLSDGTTLLTVAVADQSALHGLLQRVRDFSLVLISVACMDSTATAAHSVRHQTN